MERIRWGVLSTAKIGRLHVIPAIQRSQFGRVTALASRDLDRAHALAEQHEIAKAYGSYEELLAAGDVDAVYIPLPNHLHVPWSIRALESGKHVLCEKPIGLSVTDALRLVAAANAHPRLKVMEAFMFRHHPQWLAARKRVREGQIGEIRTVQSLFSYFNDDPTNIRNQAEIGGGALMDIGCYPISLSRFLFASEPLRVLGAMERDPVMRTDRLTSGILEFVGGTSTFTCSTQLAPFQRVQIFGTTGRIEIEIPFNAPADRPCRVWLQRGAEIEEIQFETRNQYTIQADLFARAVLDDTAVPTPLADAVANMRVIERVVASARDGQWT